VSLTLHSFPTRRSSDLLPLPRVRFRFPAMAVVLLTTTLSLPSPREIVRLPLSVLAVPPRLIESFPEAPVIDRLPLMVGVPAKLRSEEHTSELQSPYDLV